MWPFKAKSIVDADAEAWLTENFCWLIQQFGCDGIRLVLPKPGYFRTNGETGHSLALTLFEQVKGYCGIGRWRADLVVDDNPLAQSRSPSVIMVAPQKHAAGTFSVSGGRAQISYVPRLLERPDHFIATMAHECGHYLLQSATGAPPCEKDENEFLTDLTAIFMGFGVFMANARFESGPSGMSWRGYLPERDIVFALALFLRARGMGVAEAKLCLKPHLATQLGKAMRYLADDAPAVKELRRAVGGLA